MFKRKIALVLAVLFIISLSGCKKSESGADYDVVFDNEAERYGFLSPSEIKSSFKNYSIYFNTKSLSEGRETDLLMYNIIECEKGYFCGINSVAHMYQKRGRNYYVVDMNKKINYVVDKDDVEFEKEILDDMFFEYFLNYQYYVDELVYDSTADAMGRSCKVYNRTLEDGSTETYYIDDITNICLKYQVSGYKKENLYLLSWEITDLTVGKQTLEPYIDYTIVE